MTRPARSLLTFSVIGVVLHLGLSWLAHRAGDVYKQGVFMVGETKRKWARDPRSFQKGKMAVVFLGNSIQLSGLKPDVFDEHLGGKTNSFNFALPALPLGPGFFAVRDLTQNWGRPDVIVVRLVTDTGVEPGLFDYNAIQGMGFPGEFFSYLVHRRNKIFALNYLVPLRMYSNEVLRYFKNILMDPADIHKTKQRNAAILERLKHDRGWYYVEQQKIFEDGRLPEGYALATSTAALAPIEPEKDFDWNADPYLRPFFDFTAEHGIQVFLIGSVYRAGTTGVITRMPASFEKIALEYPNVRVSSQSWQRRLLHNRYFSDKTHLNPDGARLYTDMIAADFSEAFAPELRRVSMSPELLGKPGE